MPYDLRKKVAIVGAAETDRLGRLPDMSFLQLHANAAQNALRDAGLDKSSIDGFATSTSAPVGVCDYLGITPSYIDATAIGGSSFMIHVAHAVAALSVGYCNYVLITHGESGRSRSRRARFCIRPWFDARPVREALWRSQSSLQLLNSHCGPHVKVWYDRGAAGVGRGGNSGLGSEERAGDVPRADHYR